MKVLVIGASGFIGRHCIDYFQRNEYEVFGADVVSSNSNCKFFLVDKNNTDFSVIFSTNRFDVCINASGAASVPFSLEAPKFDFDLNTGNVIKILEAIRVYDPGILFINLSSAAVYGNPETLPVSELMKPSPISPYGLHKYYAEQICNEYALFYNIKTCNLRIFSAYGPGLRKQFFWDLFNKLTTEYSVELFGTGHESRDFIYIEDIARSIELIIRNSLALPKIINVASGIETTISEAAQVFSELLGMQNDIRFGGQIRVGDPVNWHADISFLRSIGFTSTYNLRQGLEEYILWLRKEKK